MRLAVSARSLRHAPQRVGTAPTNKRVQFWGLGLNKAQVYRLHPVYSSPETEEARSPADAPQEWETPIPSKRPDIFPEFEKMERVFLPKPLPGDPEVPDEEEDEMKKRTFPGDPDPEQKPGEPSEPEGEPGQDPEKGTELPSIPE